MYQSALLLIAVSIGLATALLLHGEENACCTPRYPVGESLRCGKMEYNPSLHAKGKAGQKKRYFKGTKKVGKKPKTQPDQNLSVGTVVIYQYQERIFRGWIKEVLGSNTWTVTPTPSSSVETVITTHESPIPLSNLKIDSFQLLQSVLAVWDEHDSYTTLVCGTVFSIEHDHAWITVAPQFSKHAIKCYQDDVCLNPYSTSDLPLAAVSSDFSVYDGNVIDAVLVASQQELTNLRRLYHAACSEADALSEDNHALRASYTEYLSRVDQLENDLEMNYDLHLKEHRKIKALQNIIDTQNQTLKLCQSKLVMKQQEIENLQALCESQQEDLIKTREQLANTKRDLRSHIIKNKKLSRDNESLLLENQAMTKELETERMKKLCTSSLEVVMSVPPSRTGSGSPILARASGSKDRSTTLFPVPVTRIDSKDASLKTLERRAKVLSKFINLLSSTDEKASEGDTVRTLSAYFRQNPCLLTQICEQVNLNVIREITPAEAVDLKVLLRLPMNRIRELRTFLGNLGIRILPSENLIYSELAARNTTYDGSIEIGTALLKKTVSAERPTEITYVKVQSLVGHVQKVLSRLDDDESLTLDGSFNSKLWLKIGGDKGGSSTKLAMQVANNKDCNSPDKTELIGIFEATDSHENLMAIFGSFTQDFTEIQKNFMVQHGGKMKECEVFLFGDYEFLCKMLGHMGASASYPCLWCHIRLSDLSNNQGPHSPMLWDNVQGSFTPNPEWPTKRTTDGFINDLANNKLDRRRNGDMRANGANHNSIAYEPILPVVSDVDHIVPPSLHILLGLVVRYYKYLETLCHTLDHGTLGERDAALNQQWEAASVAAKEADLAYLSEETNLREEEQLLKDFRASVDGNEMGRNQKCSLPLCAWAGRELYRGDVQWIQCTQCGVDYNSGWFHIECLRLKTGQEDAFSICPVCDGTITTPADVIQVQKERIDRAKRAVTAKKRVRDTTKSDVEKIYGDIRKTHGPKEAELNRIVEKEIKVQKQAYHSQCFVGNHCKKILNNINVLCSVLEPSSTKEKLVELFTRLRDIFSFFTARFLCDEEVTDLCQKCWALGEWFPVNFPEERIPPKLHMLIAHIPDCARRWKTVGLLSEQGLESIHSSVNREERVYASVREKRQRMKLIFNQHSQRVMASKSGLKVTRRKCVSESCGGRFKVQDGQRKCQKCGVVDC